MGFQLCLYDTCFAEFGLPLYFILIRLVSFAQMKNIRKTISLKIKTMTHPLYLSKVKHIAAQLICLLTSPVYTGTLAMGREGYTMGGEKCLWQWQRERVTCTAHS
jgi:hypothetical protein